MRLSTVFFSSTFIVLAGVNTLAKEDVLEPRFADCDFLSEVEPRAFDNEHSGRDVPRSSPERYNLKKKLDRVVSASDTRNMRASSSFQSASSRETGHSQNHRLSSQEADLDRRSYYLLYDDGLVARGPVLKRHLPNTNTTEPPKQRQAPKNQFLTVPGQRQVKSLPNTKYEPKRHSIAFLPAKDADPKQPVVILTPPDVSTPIPKQIRNPRRPKSM